MFGQLNNPNKGRSHGHGFRSSAARNNAMADFRYQDMRGSFMDGSKSSMRSVSNVYGNTSTNRMPSVRSFSGFQDMSNQASFMYDMSYNNGFPTGAATKVFSSRHDQSLVQSAVDFPVRFSSYGMNSWLDMSSYNCGAMSYVEYMFDGPSEDIFYENFKEAAASSEVNILNKDPQKESLTSNASIFVEDNTDANKGEPSTEEEPIPPCIITPPEEDPPAEESVPAQAVVCVKQSRSSCRRSARPYSRAQTIDCVEFPKGEEMTDELTVGDLGDQAKQAFEMVRQERARERGSRQLDRQKDPSAQGGVANKKDPQAKVNPGVPQNQTSLPANGEKSNGEGVGLDKSKRGKGLREGSPTRRSRTQGGETGADKVPAGAATGLPSQSRPPNEGRLEEVTNHVRTLVMVESITKGNQAITCKDNQITYHGQVINATEVKKRKEGSFESNSQALQQLCKIASKGFNVALLSSEAPNTSSRFMSPVWQALTQIVRKVLTDHTNEKGCIEPDFELSCALGYILNDKCKDIFTEGSAAFEKITIKTSPIYGANLQELQYYRITDAATFEEHLSACLARANTDSILSSFMEGFVGAFLNMRQGLKTESGERDICLSSIIVTSAGSDVKPYTDSLNRDHNIYGSIFHLAVFGPCFMCYMLNIADDDTMKQSTVPPGSNISAELEKLFSLLKQMSGAENLPLRSGSVRRFLTYVRQNYEKTKERLNTEDLKEDKRHRLEKFLVETNTLMEVYSKILTNPGEKLN
ncbi:unnamed protein product [Phytomonas sp. EM1]|nr:unnamed protein product [Phytomonas sp. EM1]|eukprot:CCW63694.1 unnamed protein product [Phytomonas sp. isolate EM1]